MLHFRCSIVNIRPISLLFFLYPILISYLHYSLFFHLSAQLKFTLQSYLLLLLALWLICTFVLKDLTVADDL